MQDGSESRPFGALMLTTGARVRPRDAREDKYRLARTLPPRAVDLSQPRSLLDFVPNIDLIYQKEGSCAQDSSSVAGYVARAATQGSHDGVSLTHWGWKYEVARRRMGTYPSDSGSYVADGFDLDMPGAPAFESYEYPGGAAYDYPEWMDSDHTIDNVLGHRPFYVSEGNFIENVWAALDAGEPVVFSMYWPDAFFAPSGGRLPQKANVAAAQSAHAICCLGITPGWFLLVNTWSGQWSPDAADFGFPDFGPGMCALSWDYVDTGLIFEARSATVEPVEPQPAPEPEPAPPSPGEAYAKGFREALDRVAEYAMELMP